MQPSRLIFALLLMLVVMIPVHAEQEPDVSWTTMLYSEDTDVIRIVSEDGLQATFPRPVVPDEATPLEVEMAVSRDGRYLLQYIRLNDNRFGLDIYDLLNGQGQTIPVVEGGELSLGAGSNLIFNADSTQVAVSIVVLDYSGSRATGTWEVAVIDLASGNIVNQLLPVSDPRLETSGQFVYFPQVAYFDDDGAVHIRMVRWLTESSEAYTSWAWQPDENKITSSPYGRVNADILPGDGAMVYTLHDPEGETVDVDTRFPPHNLLEMASISENTVVERETLFVMPSHMFSDARWANNGEMALFRAREKSQDNHWLMVMVNGDRWFELSADYDDVDAVEDGFLALTDTTDEGTTLYFQWHGDLERLAYNVPVDDGDTRFLWSLPAGYTFALDAATLATLDEAGS